MMVKGFTPKTCFVGVLLLCCILRNPYLKAQCNAPTGASTSFTTSSCINNGSITVNNVTGGSAGATVQYAITASSNPSQPLIGYQETPVFNNLYPGTYTVSIRYNCQGQASPELTRQVTVTGNYVSLGATFSNIRTSYCDNGGFSVSPTGGLAPRTYQLVSSLNADEPDPSGSAGPVQTSNVFNGLAGGTYFVRVRDACGNYITRQVTVPSGTTASPFRTSFVCSVTAFPFAIAKTQLDASCNISSQITLRRRQFILSPMAQNISLPGRLVTHYPDGTSDSITISTSGQFVTAISDVDITAMINAGLTGEYYLEFIDNCATTYTSLKATYQAPPANEHLGAVANITRNCDGTANVSYSATALTSASCVQECAVSTGTPGSYSMRPYVTFGLLNYEYSIDNGATWHSNQDTVNIGCSATTRQIAGRFRYCGKEAGDQSNFCNFVNVAACNFAFPATEMNNYACNGNTGMYIRWPNSVTAGETFTLEFTSVPPGQAPIPTTTSPYPTDIGMNVNAYMSQINDLLPGAYSYTVTNGCQTYSGSITLSHPHQFGIGQVDIAPSCSNADLTVQLSNTPYMAAVSTSSSYQERNIYKIELLNSAGTVVRTVITPALGNTTSPVPYSDAGNQITGSVQLLGVPAGSYTIRMTHNFNSNLHKIPTSCPLTQPIVVPEITLNPTPSVFRDCGDGNAAISVNVAGGVAPFTYKLYQGTIAQNNLLATQTTDPLFDGLGPDLTYTVLVSDQCGTAKEVRKTFSLISAVNMRHTGEACDGQSLRIYVNQTDGATYSWTKDNNPLPATTSYYDFPSFSPADYGVYRVTVDVPGCGTYTDDLTLDAESCVNLPVNLISFEAKQETGIVHLEWRTSAEVNNKGFEIEKSIDAKRFRKIEFVAPKPEADIRHYETTDPEMVAAVQYYRLKQIDLDGTFAYSKIVAVRIAGDNPLVLMPNPAEHYVVAKGVAPGSVVRIYDLNGRMVKETTVRTADAPIMVGSLGAGTYLLRVFRSGQEETVYRIFKH